MQLYTPTGVAITNWGQYLTDSVNGNKLAIYYNELRGWTQHHLQLIDWEALSLYLNKQRHTKQMKILQLQHGWQNTGSQKLTFLISELQGELPDEAMKTKKKYTVLLTATRRNIDYTTCCARHLSWLANDNTSANVSCNAYDAVTLHLCSFLLSATFYLNST